VRMEIWCDNLESLQLLISAHDVLLSLSLQCIIILLAIVANVAKNQPSLRPRGRLDDISLIYHQRELLPILIDALTPHVKPRIFLLYLGRSLNLPPLLSDELTLLLPDQIDYVG
jgi:hypothetical protein